MPPEQDSTTNAGNTYCSTACEHEWIVTTMECWGMHDREGLLCGVCTPKKAESGAINIYVPPDAEKAYTELVG